MGKGGSFRYNSRLQKFVLGSNGQVEGFQLSDGSTVTGDLYVSAMPGEPGPVPTLPLCTVLHHRRHMHHRKA